MKEEKFIHHWDLNYGPLEPRANVLPMSCADLFQYNATGSNKSNFDHQTIMKRQSKDTKMFLENLILKGNSFRLIL